MTKLLITVQHLKSFSFLSWLWDGLRAFALAPFKFILLSGLGLLVFIAILIGGSFIQHYFVLSTLVSAGLSVILPLIVASISLTYVQLTQPASTAKARFGGRLFSASNLSLIMVYVLLVLFICLSSSYLSFLLPEYIRLLNYLLQLALIVLQLLILVALPLTILHNGQIAPFRALAYAVKGICSNFIACLLLLLVLFSLIFLSIVLAKALALVIGKLALVVYALELWFLLIWLSLTATKMASQMFRLSAN